MQAAFRPGRSGIVDQPPLSAQQHHAVGRVQPPAQQLAEAVPADLRQQIAPGRAANGGHAPRLAEKDGVLPVGHAQNAPIRIEGRVLLLPAQGAQAHAVHGAQICAQRVIAEVEIVVAKCEIITAHGIEGFGHRMMGKFVRVRQIILHQRRTLQRVSAVQHQRVSVLVDLCGQVQQAGAFAASGGVVDGEDMSVRIGRINNFKSTFHVQPLANFMRIFVESHSMASTKTISPARMAPASLQR